MANIQPATIAKRIDDQINERLLTMSRFFKANDFRLLRWEDELKELQRADAASAFQCRAVIAHMRGDIDAFEQHISAAEKLKIDPVFQGQVRLTCYSNLSLATKALKCFNAIVDIKYSNLCETAINGCSIGAFQRVATLMTQAVAAQIVLPYASQMAVMDNAASLLKRQGVTDDQCAQVVDAAGAVLRSRNLFWQDLYPQITVNEEDGTVGMRMRVDTSAQDASAMTLETADSLIEKDLDTLPFYVHFQSSQV